MIPSTSPQLTTTARGLRRGLARAVAAMVAALALVGPNDASAQESPGLEAVDEFRSESGPRAPVENRFFLKEGRFEIAPHIGYVPNNPFARRYVGGAILGYHFSEAFSAQADIAYSPDMGENDLKGLTSVLLDRAFNAAENDDDPNQVDFQQPLDKVELAASFGVAWAPLYGKINLVGETVLNFDFYGFVGAGMVSKRNYIATYDPSGIDIGDVVTLDDQGNEVKVAPYIGVGSNFFLNQLMALKIDARSAFYVDNKPQYDPNDDPSTLGQRLYNNFVASVGIAVFVPKMKPRLYNF